MKRILMPPSISRTPDFSNQFAFPLEVQEIGIPLYYITLARDEPHVARAFCGVFKAFSGFN